MRKNRTLGFSEVFPALKVNLRKMSVKLSQTGSQRTHHFGWFAFFLLVWEMGNCSVLWICIHARYTEESRLRPIVEDYSESGNQKTLCSHNLFKKSSPPPRVCVSECAYFMCTCVWRPNVSAVCHSSGALHLTFETRSLTSRELDK